MFVISLYAGAQKALAVVTSESTAPTEEEIAADMSQLADDALRDFIDSSDVEPDAHDTVDT